MGPACYADICNQSSPCLHFFVLLALSKEILLQRNNTRPRYKYVRLSMDIYVYVSMDMNFMIYVDMNF